MLLGYFALKGNRHKHLVPRQPSHHQSATHQDETEILNRLLLSLDSSACKEWRAENKMDCPQSTFGRWILCMAPSLLFWHALNNMLFPGQTRSVSGTHGVGTHWDHPQDEPVESRDMARYICQFVRVVRAAVGFVPIVPPCDWCLLVVLAPYFKYPPNECPLLALDVFFRAPRCYRSKRCESHF